MEAAFSLSQLLYGLQTAGVVTYAGKLTGTAYSTFANMQVLFVCMYVCMYADEKLT